MKRTIMIETISILFMILYLYTGISKLMEHILFKEQLAESPILAPVAPIIAWTLPFIEFIVAVMLLIPRWRLKGLYVSSVMMSAFTIYVLALVSFSDKLPCSCGGIMNELSWQQHIIVNIILTTLSVCGIRLYRLIQKNKGSINTSIA
jgi:uncharacterized membrane protein YphA (DoxX/SURF4 family)